MSRPEHIGPADIFYNDTEAQKYTSNSRIIDIQMSMSARAIELLMLPDDTHAFILDVGCGSGSVLSQLPLCVHCTMYTGCRLWFRFSTLPASTLCTLYSVQCTMYIVQCTRYSI